jgi:hypothetical protein
MRNLQLNISISISEFIQLTILITLYIITSKADSKTVRITATALQQENNRSEKVAEEESKEYADTAMQSYFEIFYALIFCNINYYADLPIGKLNERKHIS